MRFRENDSVQANSQSLSPSLIEAFVQDGVVRIPQAFSPDWIELLRDGFSMVYTFFDPELTSRGLGHYLILDHILHAQDLGLPHVYLGYWVKGSQKMDYKRRYKPLEVLDGDVWRPLGDDE